MEQSPEATTEQDPARELFFRTRMCKFFLAGKCKRGKLCSFAHGEAKVQPLPDFNKTRFCIAFVRTGKCSKGEECSFAHCKSEIRDSIRPSAAASRIAHFRTVNKKKEEESFSNQPEPPSNTSIEQSKEAWHTAAAEFAAQMQVALQGVAQRSTEQHPDLPVSVSAAEIQAANINLQNLQASMAAQFYQSVFLNGPMPTQSATAQILPPRPAAASQAHDRVQFQAGSLGSVLPGREHINNSPSWPQDFQQARDDLEQPSCPKKTPLLKVDMCKFFVQGICARGESCTFAHSKSDLRPRPNFYRTMPCFKFMKEGTCSADCKYSHSLDNDFKGKGSNLSGEDMSSQESFSRQNTPLQNWPGKFCGQDSPNQQWLGSSVMSRQSTAAQSTSTQDISDGHDLNFDVKNTFLVFQDSDIMTGSAACRSRSA